MKAQRAPQPLFQSVSPEGTDWLFLVGSDGGWAITRNGEEFDIGTSEPKSVIAGVKKYFSLIHVAAARDIASGLSKEADYPLHIGRKPVGDVDMTIVPIGIRLETRPIYRRGSGFQVDNVA